MYRSSSARGLSALAILAALAALAASLAAPPPPARADAAYQTLPFAQDWSNPALITANDSWSGVPGIVGYLGDYTGDTPTGVDPSTLLVDYSNTAVDVIANQASVSLPNGGVAEFDGIENATIALQGSGTADAPHIVLYLNTTGFENINIRYTVRDIDSSADNATQQVALHFRAGASGNFTNVPGAYLLDATTGPSLATAAFPINVILPPEANNQAQLQVRIMTTNAAPADEWVGIDDISVTGQPTGQPQDFAPNLETITPANGASTVAETNITLAFSEPVTAAADAVALTCNGAPVAFSGLPVGAPGASQIVLDPTASLPLGASCTVSVAAAKILDVDQTPTPMTSDRTATFSVSATVCPAGDTLTKISEVQGAGPATTLPGTTPVTVQGLVTALFPGFNGFFIQEEAADQDADPATSEGVFVFTGNSGLPPGVAVGDVVRVSGRPGEFSTTGSNTMTQLSQPAVVDCGSSATAAPADVILPVAALSDLERYEGMLVQLPQELTISEYFNFDRFGEYVLARPRDGEARLMTPTQVEEPGAAAQARADENLRRRIIVDDGRNTQNPNPAIHPNGQEFTLQNRFRGGDSVARLQGILAQQFGTYRIQPTAYGTYTPRNARPIASQAVGGTLRVGSMNALNYFLTADYPSDDPLDNKCGPQQNQECRGHDSDQPQELQRQRDKLVAAIKLLDPDILGMMEIENTPGVSPLADLVAALPGYAFVDTGVIGTDAIRVGLIYRTAKVTPAGAFKWLTAAADPRFRDTLNRPVLAQTFTETATGEKLTVAVAHLKSKGSDCEAVNDPDTGDGQGNCNLTRRDAALALVDWLATDPTASGDPDYLIVGDLNSYAKEDPIDAVIAGPDDAAGTADDYTNLIARFQGPLAYSYLFDAQVGTLDHALASAALTPRVTGANEPHINVDEPDLLDYDTSFKQPPQDALYEPNAYRASDHDPIIVGVDLGVPGPNPGLPGPGPVDPNDPNPNPGPDPSDPNDPARPRLYLPLLRQSA